MIASLVLLLTLGGGDPDVEIFSKAVSWALKYEPKMAAKDETLAKKCMDRGFRRGADENRVWTKKKGKVIRGFRSAIDDSIQPYGLIVPESYDAARPIRLDVVLHGSQQPTGLSELKFIERFDDGDDPDARGPDVEYIELHPLARVENGYRWAGETDVFEAIEAACLNYSIDRRRIVLRGMSAGASGTWHLGLKHPDRFVALGPYCGYVDTHRFSETPVKGFVKVGPLPAYQEKTLTMLDSVGYAANAAMVPAIAAVGEKDVFFDCHVIMGKAMEREGLTMVNLISPGTGHVVDPATHRDQMRRIGEQVSKGLEPSPREVRFVTWTLKYNRCFWVEILGLKEHYVRAEVRARVVDGGIEIQQATNVSRLALRLPATRVTIAGIDIVVKPEAGRVELEEIEGKWRVPATVAVEGKRPGLQGPIDDAFTGPFLCVRGTGTPWHPAVQAWADASLKRFVDEWRFHFRGDLPVKTDVQVTGDDVKSRHLILFGDPGSNPWIAKALPKLPLVWTRDEIRIRSATRSAADHAPVLISESPFATGRYVVLNSGHTFHKEELKLNYLIFPRLGDWAVLKTGEPLSDSVADAGLFDEHWK